jgi:catechol 2,3-dioxygenase-like lactoylglutathione lyase family enzyme
VIHHVELWVPDLARAETTFGWLFPALGWTEHQRWNAGVSWKLDETYVVVEQSPALIGPHDRMKAGLNHLALHAGTRGNVDRLTREAQRNGWHLMFADKHPFAGGEDHYAAFLENEDGFEVELVAG